MRDLNFFEPYVEKPGFRLSKKFIIFLLSMIILLSFAIYMIYNSIVIRQESKTVQSLKVIAEEPTTVKRVEKIKEKETEINEFRESVEKIRYLDETLNERDIINEGLLTTITSKMPEGLFLTSLGVNNNEIQIVGISQDKWAVAEFKKGLEDLNYMEDLGDIFVSNISQENNYYNFTINISLEEVDEDEDEGEDGAEGESEESEEEQDGEDVSEEPKD